MLKSTLYLTLGFGLWAPPILAAPLSIPFALSSAQTLESRLEQARQLFGQGQYDQTEVIFTEIIAQHPRHAEAWLGRAMCNLRQKKMEAAVADFSQVLKLEPNHELAYSNHRGYVYLMQDQLELAIKDFDRSLAINPNYDMPFDILPALYPKGIKKRRGFSSYAHSADSR